jgi:hypothetical protein
MSIDSLPIIEDAQNPLSHAGFPEQSFGPLLEIQNEAFAKIDEEEQEPMHKWLDGSDDPWAPLNGRERHIEDLQRLIARVDAVFPQSISTRPQY